MSISLIAAMNFQNTIGLNNQLLWHLPEDMLHFKTITTGKTILMGKNTFNSIGKPLPNRENIVISKTLLPQKNIIICNSLHDAIDKYNNKNELFIIGGGQIYSQTIKIADKLYITEVDIYVNGDVFFPEISIKDWQLINYKSYISKTTVKYSLKQYIKRSVLC